MATKSAKGKPEADELSPAQLDKIWEDSRSWRGSHKLIDDTLSGDDVPFAEGALFAVSELLAEEKRIADSLLAYQGDVGRARKLEYATRAFARYFEGNCTVGQAFGVERAKKGRAPARRSDVVAVAGLIRYLHDRCGYPLTESRSSVPTAFEVASILFKRMRGWDVKPGNLRKTYWPGRPRKRKGTDKP